MEVKDINNSVNPLLFNKNAAVAASGQALGAGFASLLGQTSMVMDILPVRPEVTSSLRSKHLRLTTGMLPPTTKRLPLPKLMTSKTPLRQKTRKRLSLLMTKTLKITTRLLLRRKTNLQTKRIRPQKLTILPLVPASAEQQNVPQAPVAEEVNPAAAEVVVAENVVAANVEAAVPETLLSNAGCGG